jgi:hypothetical protein
MMMPSGFYIGSGIVAMVIGFALGWGGLMVGLLTVTLCTICFIGFVLYSLCFRKNEK